MPDQIDCLSSPSVSRTRSNPETDLMTGGGRVSPLGRNIAGVDRRLGTDIVWAQTFCQRALIEIIAEAVLGADMLKRLSLPY